MKVCRVKHLRFIEAHAWKKLAKSNYNGIRKKTVFNEKITPL